MVFNEEPTLRTAGVVFNALVVDASVVVVDEVGVGMDAEVDAEVDAGLVGVEVVLVVVDAGRLKKGSCFLCNFLFSISSNEGTLKDEEDSCSLLDIFTQ